MLVGRYHALKIGERNTSIQNLAVDNMRGKKVVYFQFFKLTTGSVLMYAFALFEF